MLTTNTTTCDLYQNCGDCLTNSDCAWCTTDSHCIAQNSRSGSCSSELLNSCDESYYTIIFIIVLSVTLCLCCTTCYCRKVRRNSDTHLFQSLLSPLLPDRARSYLFRHNSLAEEGEHEWMCIICGFDNKPRNAHCIMCGTSHEFSSNYKGNKLKKQLSAKGNKVNSSSRSTNMNDDIEALLSANNNDIVLRIEDETTLTSSGKEEKKPPVDELKVNDPDLSSLSLSLRYFNATNDQFSKIGVPLTSEKKSEALNFRRMNQLSLRQKSARRRKMWRRIYDEQSQSMVWVRTPLKNVKVGTAPFGFTPRNSISEYLIRDNRGVSSDSGNHNNSFLPINVHEPLLGATSSSSGSRVGSPSKMPPSLKNPLSPRRERASKDSFGDSVLYSSSPGFTSVFDEDGELVWQKIESGLPYTSSNFGPSTAKLSSIDIPQQNDERMDGNNEQQLSSQSFRYDLPSIAAYTFKDKQIWFCERMSEIQKPWTDGFVRIEIRRNKILEDSYRAWMQLDGEDLHKWMRYQFRGNKKPFFTVFLFFSVFLLFFDSFLFNR
jgi:hypothetical protein